MGLDAAAAIRRCNNAILFHVPPRALLLWFAIYLLFICCCAVPSPVNAQGISDEIADIILSPTRIWIARLFGIFSNPLGFIFAPSEVMFTFIEALLSPFLVRRYITKDFILSNSSHSAIDTTTLFSLSTGRRLQMM